VGLRFQESEKKDDDEGRLGEAPPDPPYHS
jgi:hypothetical protein